jgi:hypothetical protein
MFMALGDENSLQARSAAQGFLDKVQALKGDQVSLAATGAQQGGAQLFHACILLTLYNADSHLSEPHRTLGDCSLSAYIGFRSEKPV